MFAFMSIVNHLKAEPIVAWSGVRFESGRKRSDMHQFGKVTNNLHCYY